MKEVILFMFVLGLSYFNPVYTQSKVIKPKISEKSFTVTNRAVDYQKKVAHLNAMEGDGVLWLNDFVFKDGTIELDMKGLDLPGRSFVGLAFHGQNETTFDAIYFRPFNFKNMERNTHSVQYIFAPENEWQILRKNFPGKYENVIQPVPDPVDEWFHVRLVVKHPQVTVFVNGSENPTIEVSQISQTGSGKIGFWVGHNSEGWFKNLVINTAE